MKKLVCDECVEKNPSTMSCIHTFGPPTHKSTILSEATAIPGVIPDPEGDEKAYHAPLVEKSRISMPSSRKLELPESEHGRFSTPWRQGSGEV
jgi:hypothetical protein